MIPYLRRAVRLTSLTVVAVVGVAVAGPKSAAAQTVFSTFTQPGDLYDAGTQAQIWMLTTGNWMASSFLYSGPGVSLTSIRFAGLDLYVDNGNFPSPLDISFRAGPNIGSSVVLETWQLPDDNGVDQIYTLTSTLNPALITNTTYWVELSVIGYEWGWNYNSHNPLYLGTSLSTDGGVNWTDYANNASPAFEVNGGSVPATVIPEPATMTLMALGLVGMAGMRRRRIR